MIVEKAFLDKLKEFGLNSYESKLWTALLSRGISTAGELADISGVPRSRSYDVLESLAHKGFILIKNAKPIKYVAVSPKDVLDRVKAKISEQQKEDLKQIDSLKAGSVMDELQQLHKQGVELVDAVDLTGAIKGRDNQEHHLNTMIKSAKKSICIVTTKSGLKRKAERLKEALMFAKKNGAKIRIAAPLTKDTKDIVKQLSAVGEVRDYDGSGRFVIVDDREVFFMLMDDKKVHKNYDTALWVNTEYFSSAFCRLFDNHWKNLPKRRV
jgi:sugar-specific transcriptional regulator TrmB